MIKRSSIKSWLGGISQRALQIHYLPGRCVVFTFHRVLTEKEFECTHFQRSIAVSDVALRHFLVGIREQFNIISLQQLIEHKQSSAGTLDPEVSYACITFDDGWYDNYTNAFPILKELSIPATIFLSTDYIGSTLGFWWQQLGDTLLDEALTASQRENLAMMLNQYLTTPLANSWEADRIIDTIKHEHYDHAQVITEQALTIANKSSAQHGLSWSQCQEMSNYHISFGSHSISHPRLSLLPRDAQEHELMLSKVEITQKGLSYVNVFCYPYGDFNDLTLELVKENYDFGLTTKAGVWKLDSNNTMQVPRINVHQNLALDSGWLNYRLMRVAIRNT
ncbi:MAG: polysaccharide deacetylase family protein [Pseudomonadales bacterium]|nr:polysaccharide deacetylase family protein [Pseudomonadales bacterium]